MPNYAVDVIVGKVYRLFIDAPDDEHIACWQDKQYAKRFNPFDLKKLKNPTEFGTHLENYQDILDILLVEED